MNKFLTSLFLIALLLGIGFVLSSADESKVVWKDPKTGLMWQVKPNGDELTWAKAKAHCENLVLGGHDDWRLPTIGELRSLIRGCTKTEQGGACGISDACLEMKCAKPKLCYDTECGRARGQGPDGEYWPPQLEGLAKDCKNDPTIGPKGEYLNPGEFDMNKFHYHWYLSSSVRSDNEKAVWGVDFCYGAFQPGPKDDDSGQARCVRK